METDLIPDEQLKIVQELKVVHAFNSAAEVVRRSTFLADQLINHDRQALILGISGGVDSLVAGYLVHNAVERVRSRGHKAQFIAVRLPYGVQHDEADAQLALKLLQPDQIVTIDIKPATDALVQTLRQAGLAFLDAAHEDFVIGKLKVRQRMVAQYAIAGAVDGLVVGTDHAADALMGLFTKYGDGACDVAPLSGLIKQQVRQLGMAFGAPESLVMKTPIAGLESLAPGKLTEDVFGVTYAQIDEFLKGNRVDSPVYDTIVKQYRATAHKRGLPTDPFAADPSVPPHAVEDVNAPHADAPPHPASP
ncbi:ammonia-dependent NAD(+) synthetase [Oxalobacteraceae bacterium CAVE-383]|nr:ammonia-dependent NAD(+) synthetase [Oxalobacteraceae bacterium CAVE-383]